MASVKWTHEGLNNLARLDAWRFTQGWEPISLDLMDAVETYFRRWNPSRPPHYVPGRRVHADEKSTDLRMVAVSVRSKPFRVYFRYLPIQQAFEVLRVLHPHAE